jgi:anti-sigma regulatory factor (Ser/Thr protein kinase)
LLEVLDIELVPESPAPSPGLEVAPIRTMPPSLGLALDIRTYVRPEHGGDFFAFVPVAPGEVLLAAVDIAGNGLAAMPAARYLRGWIRGRALAPGPPRLDSLAEDLREELTFTGIEAAWYLALVRSTDEGLLRYQAIADSFPAPVLLVDEAGKTHPSVATGPGSPQLTFSTHRPPVTLALASDGMLRRLGGGDEHAGRRTVRRWLAGERRRWPIEAQFGSRQGGATDEALAVVRWSPWDDRYVFDIADTAMRHDVQRTIRSRAREVIGELADDLGRALAEALNNVLNHAYGGAGGRVEVVYRTSPGRFELEVRDDGSGAFGNGDGVELIRRSCASALFRDTGQGHVVYLRCDSEQTQ